MAITVGEDTYVTVAEADTYFTTRYGYDLWDALTEPNKESALVSAAAQLDVMCLWYGSPSEDDQDMAFPRTPDADPTPQAIKDAQCEMAYSIVAAGSADVNAADPVTRLKAGDVELEFKVAGGQTSTLVNDYTKNLLRGWGVCHYGTETARVVPMARG